MFVSLVMQIEVWNIVQWYAISFCVKFDENATTAHGNLRWAFGDNAVSRAQTLHWHKMFSEGRTLVEDEQHSGRQQYRQVTTQHG
jgi:hypothetical protein